MTPHQHTIYDPITQANRHLEVSIRRTDSGLWDFEVSFAGADGVLARATNFAAEREDIVLARAIQAAREALTKTV